jgi:hypothetical protein
MVAEMKNTPYLSPFPEELAELGDMVIPRLS